MANKLNLDQSQRVDVVCRKNDTFSLKLQISDENGVAVNLSSGWSFNMDVRTADTDNTIDANRIMSTQIPANPGSQSGLITTDGAGSMNSSGEVLFTCQAEDMGVASGLFVYDIQQVDTSSSPNIVETVLYGTFQINEDVTITA
jgi:hypothetical protein